jgi:hypothetical protein
VAIPGPAKNGFLVVLGAIAALYIGAQVLKRLPS